MKEKAFTATTTTHPLFMTPFTPEELKHEIKNCIQTNRRAPLDLLDLKTGVDGWRLVRFLPPTSPTWYASADNLNGTSLLGTANNFTSEWSVPFGEFDEFCFGTLGLQKWLYCTKDAAIGTEYDYGLRPVKKSFGI